MPWTDRMPNRHPRPLSPLKKRLLRLRLQRLLRQKVRLRLAVTSLLLTACTGQPDAAPPAVTGHMFSNQPSGVALELPPNWAGRYRAADSITMAADGLERELTLRMVKADSSLVPEPMLVIRVFSNTGWGAVPPDTAAARWGTVIAKDAARTLAVKPASGNPLQPGTADALAYDSLMMAVLQRPMKASLRAP